jgi:glycosyltransferase involved in cell wall biosynthesis
VVEPDVDIVILIPVFNDWEAVGLLLDRVAPAFAGRQERVRVLLVDDGSVQKSPEEWRTGGWGRFLRVDVLELRRNLGHQRALAIGLCHVEANIRCRAVLVMDGDGEDSPADIPRLLDRLDDEDGRRVVFAERTKRSESFAFRFFYGLYRWLHLLLTGIPVRVGNFSAMPYPLLRRLVGVSELWNHYAAAVFKARLPYSLLPTQRANRLAGKPQMNFVALVIHGLSAISVFSDRVGVRLLIAATLLFVSSLASLVGMGLASVVLAWAPPGWAVWTAGLALIVAMQIFMLLAVFVFVTLGGREGSSFLPLRDYVYYIGGGRRLYPDRPESMSERGE